MGFRVYLIVAAAIAGLAFGLAQWWPGSGMMFVALATTLWTGWSATRGAGCSVRAEPPAS